MSRLHGNISPYLLAHQDNPIDWFPWGGEAFDEAKRRDVPILVSIGYHTCHWCHVMARESFSDDALAQVVNAHMVSIKVDREEHPDVDAHYMSAAQAFTPHVGWPLNVFVTPDGHPFYAATYLPPTATENLPSFADVVQAVSSAWQERRSEVEDSARALTDALRVALAHRDDGNRERVPWGMVIAAICEAEDPQWGGFVGSNKFPMAPVLSFLLDQSPHPEAVQLAKRTLDRMAASDLRDPIEGGFFRYATQPDWSHPHYERMLTDNALLLTCYAKAGREDIARGIISFLHTVMATDGGLASAQHSESIIDGQLVEGGYYRLGKEQREREEPPERDRKVITGWMGLVLSGLAAAEQAGISGSGQWGIDLASELLARHRPAPGILHRVSIEGRLSEAPATLEDYGGLAKGLLDLGLATGTVSLCEVAKDLVDECAREGNGTRLVAAGVKDPLIGRLSGGERDISEGSVPSGEALIAQAAAGLCQLTGNDDYSRLAGNTVAVGYTTVTAHPLSAGGLGSALVRLETPHWAIVVVDDDWSSPLRGLAGHIVSGRTTVACVTRAQARQFAAAGFALFEGRSETSGVAYICQGHVCEQPDTTAEDFHAHLTRLGVYPERGSLAL